MLLKLVNGCSSQAHPHPLTKVMTFFFACQLVPPEYEDFFFGGGGLKILVPPTKIQGPPPPPPPTRNILSTPLTVRPTWQHACTGLVYSTALQESLKHKLFLKRRPFHIQYM